MSLKLKIISKPYHVITTGDNIFYGTKNGENGIGVSIGGGELLMAALAVNPVSGQQTVIIWDEYFIVPFPKTRATLNRMFEISSQASPDMVEYTVNKFNSNNKPTVEILYK